MNNFAKYLLGCVVVVTVCTIASISGAIGGYLITMSNLGNYGDSPPPAETRTVVESESSIIDVVENNSNSVVSIVVSKELPNIVRRNNPYSLIPDVYQDGTTERQIGAGTGFIISEDGMIVTNRHVVDDEDAEYTAILQGGETATAQVLARDTLLDIALLQIDTEEELNPVELGDSDQLKAGQRVIAIGYALGEFENTVSEGIVSGLSRTIMARGDNRAPSTLEGIIQTDASINPGNSGGPLLNYGGEVVGVNVAIAANAENIGFAIPINEVKRVIDSVEEYGEVRRPRLGVRFIQLNAVIAEANDLPVDYGALVTRGETMQDLAVIPGSPADRAGIQENDIIVEINGEKLEGNLQNIIQNFNIGDEIELTILSRGETKTVTVTLDQVA